MSSPVSKRSKSVPALSSKTRRSISSSNSPPESKISKKMSELTLNSDEKGTIRKIFQELNSTKDIIISDYPTDLYKYYGEPLSSLQHRAREHDKLKPPGGPYGLHFLNRGENRVALGKSIVQRAAIDEAGFKYMILVRRAKVLGLSNDEINMMATETKPENTEMYVSPENTRHPFSNWRQAIIKTALAVEDGVNQSRTFMELRRLIRQADSNNTWDSVIAFAIENSIFKNSLYENILVATNISKLADKSLKNALMTKYDELSGGAPLTIPKLIELVHATYDRDDLIEYYKKLYTILYDGKNIESPKQDEDLVNAMKLYDKEFLLGRYTSSEEGISLKQQIKRDLDTYKNVQFKKYICGVEFKLSEDYYAIIIRTSYNIVSEIDEILIKKDSILKWGGKLIDPQSIEEKIENTRCLYNWLSQKTDWINQRPSDNEDENTIVHRNRHISEYNSIHNKILVLENFKRVFEYIAKVKECKELLKELKKLEKRPGESEKRADAREKAVGKFMESFKEIEEVPVFAFDMQRQTPNHFDDFGGLQASREFFNDFITNFKLVQKDYIELAMKYGDIESKKTFFFLLEKVNRGEMNPDAFRYNFKATKLVRPKAPQPIKAISSKSAPEASELKKYSVEKLKEKALKVISEKEKRNGDKFPYTWAIRVYNMYVVGKDGTKEYEKGKPIRAEGLYWRVKHAPTKKKTWKITLEVGSAIDSDFIPLYTIDSGDHYVEFPQIQNIAQSVPRRASVGGKSTPMEIDIVHKNKSSAKPMSIDAPPKKKSTSAKSMEIDQVVPQRVIRRAKRIKNN